MNLLTLFVQPWRTATIIITRRPFRIQGYVFLTKVIASRYEATLNSSSYHQSPCPPLVPKKTYPLSP
jgi:hypothetical protein